MHEFNIAENMLKMLENIAKEQKLTKIDKINLQIGEMLHIVNDTLIFAFDAIKKETIFKNVILNIENIPIKMKCINCSNEFLVNDDYICPKCNNGDVEIINGKELIIKSIEGE